MYLVPCRARTFLYASEEGQVRTNVLGTVFLHGLVLWKSRQQGRDFACIADNPLTETPETMSPSEDELLDEWVAELATEGGTAAEDAQHMLREQFGYRCVFKVLAALPGLPDWGRTCALDLLVELTEQPAPEKETRQLIESSVLPILESGSSLHRQYSAEVLGVVGSRDAIDPLLQALERSKAGGTPGDWTEPSAIRSALRQLGHKTGYESDALLALQVDEGILSDAWYVDDALQALDELLHNQQFVVGLQIWSMADNGTLRWSSLNKRNIWEADYSKPYDALVIESHHYLSEFLRTLPNGKRTLVTMDWLGKGDMHFVADTDPAPGG